LRALALAAKTRQANAISLCRNRWHRENCGLSQSDPPPMHASLDWPCLPISLSFDRKPMMRTPLFFALLLSTALASAAEQSRALPPFDSVSIQGPVHMIVDAGAPQSLVIKGDEKYFERVETKVVNGKLLITFPKDSRNNMKMSSDNKILIGMPALRSFNIEGAGYAELNRISGDSIDISFQGAGKLVANGKVGSLKLQAQGVGDVDTKNLLAQRSNVTFEGIGAVKVYASERLDAVVEGMGSLSYFGNPRVLNKTVEGIGTVKAGN
jgi:hypothetical protein